MAVSLLLVAPAAAGPTRDTPREQRERVRQQRADVAAQLDVLRATNGEVEQALADLNANVAGQEAALADAQRAATEAEAAAGVARQREAEIQAELSGERSNLRDLAIEAYVNAGTGDAALAVLRSEDIDTAVQRRAFVQFRAGRYQDAIEHLRALEEDLTIARQQAEDASAAAEQNRAAAAGHLTQVESARDQQAAVAAEVDARIEHALGESANLEALDAQLAAQIAAEQARLAARNRSSGGGGGGSTGPRQVGDLCLRTVRGITVACSLADNLESMLAAAEADGITYGGGGYRSSESQVALRRAHCGSSDYDIYEKPPSECQPPTARPGQSMHEQGLAIDFTYNGSVISSRNNAGYRWLDANAGSFGLSNLPSEPWHWSTNGS